MLQAILAAPTQSDSLAAWHCGTTSTEHLLSSNCMWVRMAGGTYPSTGYSTTVKKRASQSTQGGSRTREDRRTPASENLKAYRSFRHMHIISGQLISSAAAN